MCRKLVGRAVPYHEAVNGRTFQFRQLLYDLFGKAIVHIFLLFFFNQPALKAEHTLFLSEAKHIDEGIDVHADHASRCCGRNTANAGLLVVEYWRIFFPVTQGICAIIFSKDHYFLHHLVLVVHADLQTDIELTGKIDLIYGKSNGGFISKDKIDRIIRVHEDAVMSNRVSITDATPGTVHPHALHGNQFGGIEHTTRNDGLSPSLRIQEN